MEQHIERNPDGLEGVSAGLKVNLSQRSWGKLFLTKTDTYMPLPALEKKQTYISSESQKAKSLYWIMFVAKEKLIHTLCILSALVLSRTVLHLSDPL